MDRSKSGFDLTLFVGLGGIGDDAGFGESLGLLGVVSQERGKEIDKKY